MPNFRIGQEVVCIYGGQWIYLNRVPSPGPDPEKDKIYIITGKDVHNNHLFLRLQGFPDIHYDAEYFRPLVKTKTDISIFKKILDKTNVGNFDLEKV